MVPMVEDSTIRFKPGDHQTLLDAMLSVPQDKASWDIVDAAGLCISTFPRLYPAQSSLKPVSNPAEGYNIELVDRVLSNPQAGKL